MDAIRTMLLNTPWWVYVLLVYLIIVGIKASKTRIINLPKLFIIPVIFAIISVHTLVTQVQIETYTVLVWVVAILLGILFGWVQVQRLNIKVDKERMCILLPGTWMTLIIIAVVFISKYYFGYESGMDPALLKNTSFEVGMLAVSGICTGFFIGRLFCYIYRFKTAKHTDLSEKRIISDND